MPTRRLAAAAAICLLLPLLQMGTASAAPSRTGAKAELNRLGTQISKMDEEYNYARIKLAQQERKIRDAQHGKKEAEARLSTLRGAASKRASAVYRVGAPGIFLMLFGSKSSSDFSRKLGAASKVGAWETGLMSDLSIASRRAEGQAEDLQAAVKKARSVKATIETNRAGLRARMKQQESILARLEAAEAAAARRRAAPTGTTAGNGATTPLEGPTPKALTPRLGEAEPPKAAPPTVSGSGNGSKAINFAYTLKGKPYLWAAAGPDSFDCSGFTMYVWKHAGVSLPHSSRAQFAATRRVARSDLQAGDLVFFGSPIHHVGLYISGDSMIDSPSSGGFVAIRSMARKDYVGAGRPGG